MQPVHLNLQRLFLLVGFISFVVTACSTPSQPQRIPTIAFINNLNTFDPIISLFKDSMKELGFIEGKSINYLYNGVAGGTFGTDTKAVDQEIEKLSGQNPDVFVSIGSVGTSRLKPVLEKTSKPGVFIMVTNPKLLNLVRDELKPGGRLTGLTSGGLLTAKGMEWFLTVAPTVKRVHIYYLAGDLTAPSQFPLLQTAADKLKVELVLHEVKSPDESIAALSTLTKGVDGVLRIPLFNFSPAQTTAYYKEAMQRGIPVGTTQAGSVVSGNLTGFTLSNEEIAKQSAQLVQQIIRGADPATLPVQPVQFKLDVNLAVANELGLTIPDSVLQQANNVVRVINTPIPPAPATLVATAQATAVR